MNHSSVKYKLLTTTQEYNKEILPFNIDNDPRSPRNIPNKRKVNLNLDNSIENKKKP